MNALHEHYRALLGLDQNWLVTGVELDPGRKRVTVGVEHAAGPIACPNCGRKCPRYDHAAERRWRHLDTMDFETLLVARLPRTNCPDCGVKTVSPCWAGPNARFTLLLERRAIEILEACPAVTRAAKLARLDQSTLHDIRKRAVARGLERRKLDEVRHLGLDEKSFGRGQDYVSVMVDIDGRRVLEVSPGRTAESAAELWKSLDSKVRSKIRAVAIDMWPAYENSVSEHAPQADVVFDRFHVMKHLNDMIDLVRRSERKALEKRGDDRLKGLRQQLLFGRDRLTRRQLAELQALRRQSLKTGRAWALKDMFRRFWRYLYPTTAAGFFREWYGWAIRSRLKPVMRVAKMLKRKLHGLLTWFRHGITNAVSEGFNGVIQSLKNAARGFRSFAGYRVAILFHCGKLDLYP